MLSLAGDFDNLKISLRQFKLSKKQSGNNPKFLKEADMPQSSDVQYPPLPLVQTWVWMMTESNSPEIQQKGQNNLISSFGSLAKANEYLVKQQAK
ncbi:MULTISPECIES: hypothetical protein [Shewanella]|nr:MULTISPECIES: hypothetical protein [Shewanella]QYJ84520.1 hypothetical protein K0H80_04320 [Shewanella aegiceratis]QYJ92053.1 hypothetical protein K0H81_15810 [Shewanella halotolerans]QYJ95939.1 hypothetical protein K0I31_04335 [Shewanella spartinae]QYJ99744.1 hypothetical protein K0J45_04345 [Shewanella alkalitolerans]QYK15045.1 hypothetical protein K0I63_04405 [Shewanella rhizosphaerae]